jgi:hypothetical protein
MRDPLHLAPIIPGDVIAPALIIAGATSEANARRLNASNTIHHDLACRKEAPTIALLARMNKGTAGGSHHICRRIEGGVGTSRAMRAGLRRAEGGLVE